MINGAKKNTKKQNPEFTAKVIITIHNVSFFSDSLKYCSSYEDFLKHQKIVQICDNIDIIRLWTPCHKSDLN